MFIRAALQICTNNVILAYCRLKTAVLMLIIKNSFNVSNELADLNRKHFAKFTQFYNSTKTVKCFPLSKVSRSVLKCQTICLTSIWYVPITILWSMLFLKNVNKRKYLSVLDDSWRRQRRGSIDTSSMNDVISKKSQNSFFKCIQGSNKGVQGSMHL